MSLISLAKVSKAYAGVPALREVSLDLKAGEIHALMGENGAGKSTLIKILAGVVAPDIAEIRIDDQPVAIESPAAAYRLGFRFIHQELSVVPALSVAENIFLGRRYPLRAGVLVDWPHLHRVAGETLKRLGITHIDPRVQMARLPHGDQMLVRISSAFLGEDGAPARLYVMDEPTAALTRTESARLFAVLREIRDAGSAVLYVSHRLDEVMALCDRATVLRDGRRIDAGRMSDITHDDLVTLMIGRQVTQAYPAAITPPSEALAFEGHGLRVRRGEVLGVAGLAGAGQRELLLKILGRPSAAWRSGIAYVPRERRAEGLVLTRPIFENITLAHLGNHSFAGAWLTPRHERRFATGLGDAVRLRSTGPRQRVMELSGGNQQKVVFARALAGDPKLLLLDEPTRGVDIGAKLEIYTLMREMTAKGMATIVVSSDLPELIGMCDRIAVIRDGEITETIPAAGLGEDDLLNRCYGRARAAAA
jgi:ribose transport system ATP-binding protein